MNTFFSKFKDFVGLNDTSESEDYDYQETEIDEKNSQKRSFEQTFEEEEERPVHRRYQEPTTTTTTTTISQTQMETSSRNNVIGMPGINTGMSEVVVFEPHSFEEMPKVIQTLRQRRSVVLNLNVMDPDEAQRAVDFVAGGTYAIDGHQERIGESIFLFTPNSVKVSTVIGSSKEEPEVVPPPQPQVARTTIPPHPWGSEKTRIAQ